jgi:hypothetical protein
MLAWRSPSREGKSTLDYGHYSVGNENILLTTMNSSGQNIPIGRKIKNSDVSLQSKSPKPVN